MGKLGRRALVLLVAACRCSSSPRAAATTTAAAATAGAAATAKTGGSITISQTSQPDYLDPALTYTVNGIEPLWLVYTPLLTYAHEEGEAGPS